MINLITHAPKTKVFYYMRTFPLYTQLDAMDCGPTCLKMIAKYHGRFFRLDDLREKSFLSKTGSSLLGLSEAANSIGFKSTGVQLSLNQLAEDAPLPCILHWDHQHFVVCYDVKQKRKNGRMFYIADPAGSLLQYTDIEMIQHWAHGNDKGIALLLEPTPEFYEQEDAQETLNRGWNRLFTHYKPYKKYLFQLLLGMVLVAVLQLIFPFLTQALVDIGVKNGDLSFIQMILIAQLLLFVAKLSVEFIRGWILLHINTRVNIALVSNFLSKVMRMPLRFFDTKTIGDLLQRIGDHKRIEQFVTGQSVALMFSFINFFLFALVLAYYKWSLLFLFLLGNTCYFAYVLLFMKKRKQLDYKRFSESAHERGSLIQLIMGMPDVKLANSEMQKRWQWEQIQLRLYRIRSKSLALGQYQQAGSVFFSQTTNILLTFMAAQSVITGEMSLGMMMSVVYIIGQLNAPIEQFIGFTQDFQDAKLSLERLNEVHAKNDEDHSNVQMTHMEPSSFRMELDAVSFSYEGAQRDWALDRVQLLIPENQVTAIVGASGSGKTTLVKMLMGFYAPQQGSIKIGNMPLQQVNPHYWRSVVGSVLQDGFIFSDTIAANIALGEMQIDVVRLQKAIQIANLETFLNDLPKGLQTTIGMDGQGLSQGQRQRILIARAVYKEPSILFFDEATNALDAKNERAIMTRLNDFYQGRTVVVVAHRLSTVRNADQIVVLDKGSIIEIGRHEELIERKGAYYDLIKNQLELGS